jgi:hypothetical protein
LANPLISSALIGQTCNEGPRDFLLPLFFITSRNSSNGVIIADLFVYTVL